MGDILSLFDSVLLDTKDGKKSEAQDSVFGSVEEARRAQEDLNDGIDALQLLLSRLQSKAVTVVLNVSDAMRMLEALERDPKYRKPATEEAKLRL